MTTNVVLVTWPEASKAYQAMSELKNQTAIRVLQAAVIVRAPDGTFSVRDGASKTVGLGSLGGGAIGALVGLLGGPLGMLLGFAGGSLFGSLADINQALDTSTVLAAMSQFVPSNGTALILEVDEDSPAAVDALVQASGGKLLRRPLEEVQGEIASAEEAAIGAAREASRVLQEQKKTEHKARREAKWEEIKAKLKAAFS